MEVPCLHRKGTPWQLAADIHSVLLHAWEHLYYHIVVDYLYNGDLNSHSRPSTTKRFSKTCTSSSTRPP